MEKEMANLTEKRRELGEQLSTSMEQCQSMKVKYNTDTKEWEEKVRQTYSGTYTYHCTKPSPLRWWDTKMWSKVQNRTTCSGWLRLVSCKTMGYVELINVQFQS